MSNHYFQFKQFRVEQENCAMKVSTDACIQGAWTPVTTDTFSVLDIGTGTGLLSLMLAQRNKQLRIDAVEIDANAAKQAKANFENSAWKERLHVYEADARSFVFEKKYDLIICNPPFFQNSLLGNKISRNHVRHQLSFGFEDLFSVLDNNLMSNGIASILFPTSEHILWKEILSKKGWIINCELHISPVKNKKTNRIISICCRHSLVETTIEQLLIRESTQLYSKEFSKLLYPFYL